MTNHVQEPDRSPGASKPARRLHFNRWRDPRLLLGVFLVTTSVLVGAYLFSTTDDTVRYWALSTDAAAGEPVGSDALKATSVRLSSSAADRYLKVSEDMPGRLSDLVWNHDVKSGELLTDTMMAPAALVGAELPLNVGAGHFPNDLRRGNLVDVWVSPKSADGSLADAERILSGVAVLSAGGPAEAMGEALSSTILIGLDEGRLRSEIISAIASGDITLVRVR